MADNKVIASLTLCLLFLLVLETRTSTASSLDENHERTERAIGGQGFHRGTYPWLVLLRATIVTRRIFGIAIDHYHLYCGAVLINNRWLLTAAHCFTEHGSGAARQAGNWEARMASSRIRPTIGQRLTDILGRVINHNEFRQWEIDVERIVMHPGFRNDDSEISNDIALVKLERPVPNVNSVRPIPLPDFGEDAFPQLGSNCIMAGWGCTRRGGSPSTWAQQVTMPVLPSVRCQRLYGMQSLQGRICAGHHNRGIGVCMGDSGGPLVCRRNTTDNAVSEQVLGGIVSFTSRSNPGSHPAVFTKVQDFTPWIARIINRY